MDNPETLATLGTQDIGRQQQQQKTTKKPHNTENKKDEQHGPHQYCGEPRFS